MVLVIDRTEIETEADDEKVLSVAERVAELEGEGHDSRSALKRAARELGLSRDEAYRRLVSERARLKEYELFRRDRLC